MLGGEFRKLRKAKNLSMKAVCQGITSSSSLQRWELGKGQMDIDKVIKLLDRLHVNPDEFMELVGINEDKFYEEEVARLYEQNDVQKLKILAHEFLQEYEKTGQNKALFKAAIACNFYTDLSNKRIFPPEYNLKLRSRFVFLKSWTQEDVLLFGNIVLLLSAQDIYLISRSLYSYLAYHQGNRLFAVMAVNTLLNSVFALLKQKEKTLAAKLLAQIKDLSLPQNFSNEKIRIKLMDALMLYLEQGQTKAMQQLITNLNSLGMKDKAQDFKFAFEQIKAIYQVK